jgi:hypothetical protein
VYAIWKTLENFGEAWAERDRERRATKRYARELIEEYTARLAKLDGYGDHPYWDPEKQSVRKALEYWTPIARTGEYPRR